MGSLEVFNCEHKRREAKFCVAIRSANEKQIFLFVFKEGVWELESDVMLVFLHSQRNRIMTSYPYSTYVSKVFELERNVTVVGALRSYDIHLRVFVQGILYQPNDHSYINCSPVIP